MAKIITLIILFNFLLLPLTFESFSNDDLDVYVKCDIAQVVDIGIKMYLPKVNFNLGQKKGELNPIVSRSLSISVHKLHDFSNFFVNNFVVEAELDKSKKKITINLKSLEKNCNCTGKDLSSLTIDYKNGLKLTDLYFMSSQIDNNLNDLLVKCSVKPSKEIRSWEN